MMLWSPPPPPPPPCWQPRALNSPVNVGRGQGRPLNLLYDGLAQEEDHHQQDGDIDEGANADAQGFILTAIRSGTGMGFEVSSREAVWAGKRHPGCSRRDRPRWAFPPEECEGDVEFGIACGGRGGLLSESG